MLCSSEKPYISKKILSPSSELKNKPSKKPVEVGGRLLLLLVSCVAYCSVLKMEAMFSSKTLGSPEPHGVMTQETIIFAVIAMRTLNPT
jgi:hypothetical protein